MPASQYKGQPDLNSNGGKRVEEVVIDVFMRVLTNLRGHNQGVVMCAANGIYTIIFAVPADSLRHGLFQKVEIAPDSGSKKMLLADACQLKKTIIVQDAINDQRVEYMRDHIRNKQIRSVAVYPAFFRELTYLSVIDKVAPSEPGFCKEEIVIMERCSAILQSDLAKMSYRLRNSRTGEKANGQNTLKGIINHYLRNRTPVIGGLAKRLYENGTLSEEQKKRYAQLIMSEIAIFENDLLDLSEFLSLEDGSAIGSVDLADCLRLISGGLTMDGSVKISQGCPEIVEWPLREINFIVSQMAKYLADNSKGAIAVRADCAEGKIAIEIANDAFAPYKDTDIKLNIIKYVVEHRLDGAFQLSKDCLVILLPC